MYWVQCCLIQAYIATGLISTCMCRLGMLIQEHQLAQTEDLINSVSIPACASPRDSFPRPATPEMTTYTRQSMLHRPSFELKSPILAGLCQCGLQHRYIIATEACDVYCTEAHLGCKLKLSRQQCDFNNPECTLMTEDGLFYFSDRSCMALRMLYLPADQYTQHGKPVSVFQRHRSSVKVSLIRTHNMLWDLQLLCDSVPSICRLEVTDC